LLSSKVIEYTWYSVGEWKIDQLMAIIFRSI